MRLPESILVYVTRRTGRGREYLMLHRCADFVFWQGVSGGMETGEAPHESARRELLEETGLIAELLNPSYSYSFPLDEHWKHKYGPEVREIIAYVFIAKVDQSATIRLDSGEHDEYRWCSFEEASQLFHWPEDREALRVCDEWLAKRCL